MKIHNTNEEYAFLFPFDSNRGLLRRNSNLNLDTVSVILVFNSGDDLIGGMCTYIDNVRSSETKPFEIDSYGNLPEFDSYEVYSMQW